MNVGRKPKPTKLKELEGNPGKRPLNKNEPIPPQTAPECPEWLSDKAKEEWARAASVLERLWLLTELDMAAFAGYCQSYAKWRAAEEFLKKKGNTYAYPRKDKDGNTIAVYIAPYPEVAIARQSLEQVRQFCIEFGLTPSSRGRMSLPTEDPDDPFEKHLLEER